MVKKKIIKNFKRCVEYQETLLERLKDRDYAVEYLNTAIEESFKGDFESLKFFLNALKNVAEAQGRINDLAKRARLRRETLYRIFSENGNPELHSLASVLHAMGFILGIR